MKAPRRHPLAASRKAAPRSREDPCVLLLTPPVPQGRPAVLAVGPEHCRRLPAAQIAISAAPLLKPLEKPGVALTFCRELVINYW